MCVNAGTVTVAQFWSILGTAMLRAEPARTTNPVGKTAKYPNVYALGYFILNEY